MHFNRVDCDNTVGSVLLVVPEDVAYKFTFVYQHFPWDGTFIVAVQHDVVKEISALKLRYLNYSVPVVREQKLCAQVSL